jgi:hypothetical protein
MIRKMYRWVASIICVLVLGTIHFLAGCTQAENLTAIGDGVLAAGRMTGDGIKAVIGWMVTGTLLITIVLTTGCSQESRHNIARDVVYTVTALDDLGYEGDIEGTLDPTSSTTFGAGGFSHVSKCKVDFKVHKTKPAKPKDQLLCPWLSDPFENTMDNVPITPPSQPVDVTTQPAKKD